MIIFFCSIICISVVSAADVNSSDDSTILSDVEYSSNDVVSADLQDDSSDTEVINKSNCECCSFLIQENGETVYGFRQDSPLNGFGVEINEQNWNGLNIIKQEIDTTNTYFFHGIITENGWVASQGGSQYDSASRSIEQIAATIITTNDISPVYLNQIRGILSGYGYGHFVVKAPDGRYGIAFHNTYLTGTLQAGQFLVVPNYSSSWYTGDYKSYASNPVDALIAICSYEDSGLNRRDLVTYDYKPHETANGVFYGVDVFATNDNGRNVGLDTAAIVTHVWYKGQYFAPSVIPQNPGKLYLGTHIFENQYCGSSLELINCPNYVVVEQNFDAYYRVTHVASERTVSFDIGDNVDFVNAAISSGSYNYDSANHIVYWMLAANSEAKDIILTLKPKVRGDYKIHSNLIDLPDEFDVEYHATEYGTVLTADDVNKYYGNSQNLNIRLTDRYGTPLSGEKLSVLINGKTYTRTVPDSGVVSMAINLASGEYDAIVSYDGVVGKNQTTSNILINPTVFSNDVDKYFKNSTQFYASFLDSNGNVLAHSEVNFNINGVIYTRTTDDNGTAKLNINLDPNNYTITSINLATGERVASLISVRSVIVDNYDLVKYYLNGSQYSVNLVDGQGNPLADSVVSFNINGIFYNRTTNENGTAKFSINLAPGNYIITTGYNGSYVSNDIFVLNRLLTNDLSMKYGDGSKFKVVVLNEQGGIAPGEIVTFNINGKFYNRTVSFNGVAALNLNLGQGKYIITTSWNNYSVANTITIYP